MDYLESKIEKQEAAEQQNNEKIKTLQNEIEQLKEKLKLVIDDRDNKNKQLTKQKTICDNLKIKIKDLETKIEQNEKEKESFYSSYPKL